MSVVTDLAETSTATWSTSGITLTRVFLVSGLASESPGGPDQRVYMALSAAGIPAHGDVHPSVSTLYCLSRTAEAVDVDLVRVSCVYEPLTYASQPVDDDGPGVLEVGATVQPETTEVDYNDAAITVTYQKTVGATTKSDTQQVQVDIQVPQTTATIVRRETTSPLSKAFTYVGTVNNATWESGAARTWLCTGITGRTDDGGTSYEVTYSFQYNPATWDATVVYVDPETNRPPGDVAGQGAALKDVQIYSAVDFTGIGVSF